MTEPNHFAVHGAAEALEAVDVIARTTNPSLRATALVINRFRPDDREHRLNLERLADAHGRIVYDPPLPDCPGIPQSQRAVSPIHSWNSPGSREVAEIMDDLLETIVPPARPEPRVSIRRFLS